MFKLYLVIDESGRALYDDERKFIGVFDNILDAIKQFGHQFVNRCMIKTNQTQFNS